MIQQIKTGFNSIVELPQILKDFSFKKIFLVTGKKSYHSSGAAEILGKYIGPSDFLMGFLPQ